MTVANAYEILLHSSLVVLAVMTLLCLIRAIQGPRIADRIVSINMISTLTIAMIAILAIRQNQGYLMDVALIYALIGFLAVVVLCKVYMGITLEAREQKQKEENRNA
ncbi:MAG: sodium:proton antiporter [Clostridia bacterium]|nr:sodium:proton antiporter [Clostridia bacterium]